MSTRAHLRRLGMGLATVLGLSPRGFFIPYRYASGARRAAYPQLARRFEAAEPAMREVMGWIGEHGGRLRGFAGPPPWPRWDQDWFARLDGAAAYAIVRATRPARIVEIGSGHSTRFMAAAIADGSLTCRFTSIDPAPRAALAGLDIRRIDGVLSAMPPEPLLELKAGDVLFVDSSHIAMPGTDVDRLLGDVLPRLPAGVLVHLHDIFLPESYPEAWSWRGYNEQLCVACLLQGGGYDIRFASHWVARRQPSWIAEAGLEGIPLPEGAHETSLWLIKRSSPETHCSHQVSGR